MTELITTFQRLKKNFNSPWSMTDELTQELFIKTENFLQQHQTLEIAGVRWLRSQTPQGAERPLGLVTILTSGSESGAFALHAAMSGILAGNVIVMLVEDSKTREFLKSWSVQSPFLSDRLFITEGNLESPEFDLLCAHPAVSRVLAFGDLAMLEKTRKNTSSSWKEVSLYGPSHNTAFILNDADLGNAVAEIKKGVFSWGGKSVWNLKSVYVLESQKDAFLKALETEWPKAQSVAQTVSGDGKIFHGNVIVDLNHCSEAHQQPHDFPVLFVSFVKYTHEMTKWIQGGFLSHSAVVFGPSDKVRSFAKKVNAEAIMENSWRPEAYVEKYGWPAGFKQSHLGTMDLSPYGAFFSELQKFS